uniref:Uncharacterized protein n=1 Tax=Sinocyclocheilus rhinocerous TaxID=307959 RepID=A0A673K876_9TELE
MCACVKLSHLYFYSSLYYTACVKQSSHASGMEVMDRLTFLEQRVQMQDDEIQLLKINMTDVLKRLNISEDPNLYANHLIN